MATPVEAPAVAMVTLTIDGREVRVPRGTNLIEAARGIGIDVPYLCYHHQLTAFGGCRLCLVEVEKVPKLLAACNTVATDGMVVRTTTDRVKSQREGTLEFLLLNHPLDCPVCDKGGECELQDRVFESSNGRSRMTEPKVHIEDYDLGPLIVRNQDRCIICKRCIKVMEEIVGDPVLEFGQRGVTTEVYTFEHEEFKAGFSGNTIRVCPVGALMSKPFRFRARPWELIKTPSVCSLCSVGCNVREDVRENRLLRVVGLENPEVNDGWLCDRGQFGYDYINSDARIQAPLIRRASGEFEQASWEEALGLIATRLAAVRGASPDAFAAIGSERTTNEDAFALQAFTREVMGSPHIDHRMGSGRNDYAATSSPGAIRALGEADVVLALGTDVTAEAPVLDLVLKRGLLTGRTRLIIANPRSMALNKFSHAWLQHRPGAEAAVAEALAGGGSDAADTGLPRESLDAAAALLRQASRPAILFGADAADGAGGDEFLAAIRRLGASLGKDAVCLEVVREVNTRGAREQGLLPGRGPAGAPVSPGRSTPEILAAAVEGSVRAVWIAGANPAVDFTDPDLVRRAAATLDLLVVHDLFLTETARLAHVVLPALSLAEQAGTVTNLEGRAQRVVRALDPRGGGQPGWAVLEMLADDLGSAMGFQSVETVTRAIRKAFSAAAGEGTVPATAGDRGSATDKTTPEFPLVLFSGHLMFNRSTIQGRSTVLSGLAPDPFVELHPDDAARLDLTPGAFASVETSAGSLRLRVTVSDTARQGTAFVPAGFNEAPVAPLFGGTARTAACRVVSAGGEFG